MAVKLEEKDAADWVYRGEGAANLVLAYVGSSPTFIGKVMRIQKIERNGSSSSVNLEKQLTFTEQERLLWRDAGELVSSPNKETAGQLYVQYVMSPLLGSKYVDPGLQVLVSEKFLESVEKNVTCQRPVWRVKAARVDTRCNSVLVSSDHSIFPDAGGHCISVEIKPKCGFLPLSKFIAKEHAIKRSITRFKLHQVLKRHEQKISELSEYNPLDIFSGAKERIIKAIKDLYSTPQNNFRVFLNGSLVIGGLGGGTKKTDVEVGQAFEDLLKGFISADDGLRTMSFIELVAGTVYNSGVLDRLLEVQKRDKFDIEGAIHAYYDIVSQPCAVCGEFDEARMPQIYKSLHSIPMNEKLNIVKDYLIAATAKDCSLMISFRPREDGDFGSSYCSVHLQSTNQNFDYKANFIDLDLKRLKKMEDYYALDKKILDCYKQIVETGHGIDTVSMKSYESIS